MSYKRKSCSPQFSQVLVPVQRQKKKKKEDDIQRSSPVGNMSLLASRKRQIHEVDKYDNIKELRSSVMNDGAVTTLSPVKKGKRSVYFDGTLTDGTSHIRVVGFNPDQQHKLSSYFDEKEPARLINCEFKPTREGNTMQIMLEKFTEITSSTKKIAIPEDDPSTPNVIKIIDLPSINNFQRVSFDIKVVAINE